MILVIRGEIVRRKWLLMAVGIFLIYILTSCVEPKDQSEFDDQKVFAAITVKIQNQNSKSYQTQQANQPTRISKI